MSVVYSSHTLEHFTRKEGLNFLKECHRVLRKKGIIRIVVPDLQCVVDDYINKVFPANEFIEKLGVSFRTRGPLMKKLLYPYIQFPHKCMYNTSTLLAILNDIGFDAQSKEPFTSDIDDINKIELEFRTRFAVIVEGRKR